MTTVRPTRGARAVPERVQNPRAEAGSPALSRPVRRRPPTDLESQQPAPGLGDRLASLLNDAPDATLVAATVTARHVDPIGLFAAAAEADLEAALWLRPSEAVSLVGIGRAWAVEGDGPARFQAVETAFERLIAGARLDGPPAEAGNRPILMGGLGFTGRLPDPASVWRPFGASSMVLPALVLGAGPDGTHLTGAVIAGVGTWTPISLDRLWTRLQERARALEPAAGGLIARPGVSVLRTETEQPSHSAWNRIVGLYAGAVGRGRLDKVVLAREIDFRSGVELDVPNALRRLVASAPESTIFAFRRGGRTFLGATPERLVRTNGRSFETAAIAGTTGRGANSAEDERLAAELLVSEKDREEQRIVVAAIRQLLAPVVASLDVEPRPAIMRLRYAQHLVTRLSGNLHDRHGLLSIAALLHPTPAVGGEPRELALAFIDEHEGFERGWYAGPIGWLGAAGDGELCVALRCGIVEGTQARLFAGCGIVADSKPDAEWEESRIKLRAVVAALGIPAEEPG